MPAPIVAPLLDHPAKFSPQVLEAIAQAYVRHVGAAVAVIDPFAGIGGIHELRDHPSIPDDMRPRTFAVEIEPEWAAASAVYGPTRCADAALPSAYRSDQGTDVRWPCLITSPCYGNRFADRYRGQNDTCRRCTGTGVDDATPGVHDDTYVACPLCSGSGFARSRRYGYANSLNRDPSDGSSAAMQWGAAYRAFHSRVAHLWWDATDVGAVLIINISDHIRGRVDQGVHLWWAAMVAMQGFTFMDAIPVYTPRSRNGANREVRAGCEWLLIYKRL